MQDFGQAIILALHLVLAGDADLVEIVGLSLQVSLTAVFASCLIGLPLGAVLAISRFRGRGIVLVLLNALMGLPPVVVGLIVYLLLSNAGPLGWLRLLYSPAAMIIAQTILITPIIAALSRQVIEELHNEYAEQFRSLCVSVPSAVAALLWDGRYSLLTALLGLTGAGLPPGFGEDSDVGCACSSEDRRLPGGGALSLLALLGLLRRRRSAPSDGPRMSAAARARMV